MSPKVTGKPGRARKDELGLIMPGVASCWGTARRERRDVAGERLSLPGEGGITAIRRRVMGKRTNFEVGRKGHLRGSAPVVVLVEAPGAAAAGAARASSVVGTPGALSPPIRATIARRLGERVDGDANDWPAKGEVEELRTLFVDFDEAGKRYKDWRVATRESATYRFGDFPHHGPPECLKFVRAVTEDYENIRRWFEAWCHEYHIGEADRLYHEMVNLVEVLHLGCTYDQLNMGALASFEMVTRRLMAIVEHINSGKESGNWSTARYLIQRRGPGDLMSRELHRHVAEESRTDREILDTRKKAASAVVDAAAAGGLPALPGDDDGAGGGKARGKGGKRGRGRGR